jgi:hypothetical protein
MTGNDSSQRLLRGLQHVSYTGSVRLPAAEPEITKFRGQLDRRSKVGGWSTGQWANRCQD